MKRSSRRSNGRQSSLKPPINLEKYKRGYKQRPVDHGSEKDEDSVNPNNVSHETQLTEPETDTEAPPTRHVRSRKYFGRQLSSGKRLQQKKAHTERKTYVFSSESSSGSISGQSYGSSMTAYESKSNTGEVSQEGQEVQFMEFNSLDLDNGILVTQQRSLVASSIEAAKTVSVQVTTNEPPQEIQEELPVERKPTEPEEKLRKMLSWK